MCRPVSHLLGPIALALPSALALKLESQSKLAPPPESQGALAFLKEALSGTRRDFTEGSIPRAVILLAVPMVLEMFMESLFGFVDMLFVSKLGAEAVAAVALTEGMMSVISVCSRLRWPKSSLTAAANASAWSTSSAIARSIRSVRTARLSGIAAVKLAFCAASTWCIRAVSPAMSCLIAVAMTRLPYAWRAMFDHVARRVAS